MPDDILPNPRSLFGGPATSWAYTNRANEIGDEIERAVADGVSPREIAYEATSVAGILASHLCLAHDRDRRKAARRDP